MTMSPSQDPDWVRNWVGPGKCGGIFLEGYQGRADSLPLPPVRFSSQRSQTVHFRKVFQLNGIVSKRYSCQSLMVVGLPPTNH